MSLCHYRWKQNISPLTASIRYAILYNCIRSFYRPLFMHLQVSYICLPTIHYIYMPYHCIRCIFSSLYNFLSLYVLLLENLIYVNRFIQLLLTLHMILSISNNLWWYPSIQLLTSDAVWRNRLFFQVCCLSILYTVCCI